MEKKKKKYNNTVYITSSITSYFPFPNFTKKISCRYKFSYTHIYTTISYGIHPPFYL